MFWAIYNESNSNEQIPLDLALPQTTSTITGTIQGQDHRYVMARVLPNSIPINDFSTGVGYMESWGGSIANPAYSLWNSAGSQQCQWNSQPIGTYSSARTLGPQRPARYHQRSDH